AALFGVTVDPKAAMPRPLRNEWRDRKAKLAAKKGKPAPKKPANDAGSTDAATPADAGSTDAATPADN
ncbi:MAG: hypothetical protein ACO3Z1_09870, partial [Ilumatobacteraceae bacterium]